MLHQCACPSPQEKVIRLDEETAASRATIRQSGAPPISVLIELAKEATSPIRNRASATLMKEFGPFVVIEGRSDLGGSRLRGGRSGLQRVRVALGSAAVIRA